MATSLQQHNAVDVLTMAVNHQEAMLEPPTSERNVAPVGAPSVATIESLRARLLSERASSKEARDQAQKIALKVSELQSQLDAEIENRKKAEVALKEVLEVLKSKGVMIAESMEATFSLSAGTSESEEAAHTRSSKDGDSSSGEEASQAHIENHQRSASEALHREGLELKEEETGRLEVGGSSDQRQITMEDSLGSESPVVDKDKVNKDEEANSLEQAVVANTLVEHSHALPNQVVEESCINQPSEMPAASAKHPEGLLNSLSEWEPGAQVSENEGSLSHSSINADSSHQEVETDKTDMATTVNFLGGHHQASEGLSKHVDEVAKLKGVAPDEDAMPATQIKPGIGHRDVHVSGGLHSVDVKMTRGLTLKDVASPVKENAFGLGHKDVQLGHFPRSGYLYERPYMNSGPLQHMQYEPSAEAPFSRGPMSTVYPIKEFLSPNVADYGRHPQAPVSDAILNLIDDRNGKLGSILMALNLAKQQINDDEHASSSHMEIYEASSPSPFSGKTYPAAFEGVPCQPPYGPWRPEPHSQAPIIHFPVSPRSDYEPSAFDRHDGSRSGSNSAYYMPSYDPYLQPKGELHLGSRLDINSILLCVKAIPLSATDGFVGINL